MTTVEIIIIVLFTLILVVKILEYIVSLQLATRLAQQNQATPEEYCLNEVRYLSQGVWDEFKPPPGDGWRVMTVTNMPNNLGVIVGWYRKRSL